MRSPEDSPDLLGMFRTAPGGNQARDSSINKRESSWGIRNVTEFKARISDQS